MCCVSRHNNQCKQSVSQIPHLYAIFLWLKRKTADILRDLILTLYTTCINSLSVYCSTNKPLNFQQTGHFCSLAVSLCFERTNPLLSACWHLSRLPCAYALVRLISITTYLLSRGKIWKDTLLTCILYCGARPSCLIRECMQILITDIIIILVRLFFRDALASLRESYTFL